MVGERNRDCWNCTESEQTIHYYYNKQSYSSNKINAALPDQQLVFSRVLYTQSYTNTHPFDDLVNSTTCNLFCAEIGIYPSFPFYFPTDNEFVTATSWIGLSSPSSHTTIFCLSFKPHTNLSFSSFANSSHLMNRIHALNASHHIIHQLQRGSHLRLVLSHGSLHGELHCFSLRTSDCHFHEAFSLAIGNKEFVFERLEGQQLGQRQKARFLAKPAAPENKHVSKCFVYTPLSLFQRSRELQCEIDRCVLLHAVHLQNNHFIFANCLVGT